MLITDQTSIAAIQESFNKLFPNLKLEFYKTEHEAGEASSEKEKWSGAEVIGQIRKTHQSGDLKISGQLQVAQLEKMFHDQYGLNVQVFRHSGTVGCKPPLPIIGPWTNKTTEELIRLARK